MSEGLQSKEERVSVLKAAKEDLENQGFKVTLDAHGCEHFHKDIGEYWRPEHIAVHGNMVDKGPLRMLSDVMDEHGLKVHEKNGVSFAEKDSNGHARLVVDRNA